MPGDRVASTTADKTQPHDQNNESQGWFRDNVLNPFINGTGVRQVADTFTNTDFKPLHTATDAGIVNNAVQTVSSVVGSLAPYIVLGKVTHGVLGKVVDQREITGLASTVMKSEAVANVGAAGAYEFLKKPSEGQTRLGNTAGTMLSFSAFEAGNYGLGKATRMVGNTYGKVALIGTGRAVIGGVGGELQYDTSNLVAGLTGGENRADGNGRLEAIASGVVMNEALPVLSAGAGKVFKAALGSGDKPEPMKITLNLSGKSEPSAIAGRPLETSSALASAEAKPTADVKLPAASSPRSISSFDGVTKTVAKWKGATVTVLRGTNEPAFARAFNGADGVPADGIPKDVLPHVELTDAVHTETGKPGETPASAGAKDALTRTDARPAETDKATEGERKPQAIDPVNIGKAEVGANFTADGINFGLNSPKATNVELLIYSTPDAKEPSQILPMTKTGDIWHRAEKLPEFTAYQYRVSGEYAPEKGTLFDNSQRLLDPEAKAVFRADTGDANVNDARAIAIRPDFDWQGVHRPNTAMEDTVIYEMNVRGFTAADEALGNLRGTYRGLMEKIPYLKSLGVTAIELMPVMEFQKDMKINPETGKMLINAWGYNTVGFKAVEGRYAHDGTSGQQVAEFKEMVRELHRNGIEVIMDVVFNHTGEGGAGGKPINFKGINNDQMYLLDKNDGNKYIDKTGCGNTVNANDPVVQDFIIKSLRYWVEEMQVDGFRFDLAKALKYMPDGSFNDTAPLIEAIKNDPVLSKVKLIAEPWDMSGYGPGRFSEGWSEWNGIFRDTVRNFVKGLTGQVRKLGDVVAGSSGAGFNADKGQTSVNFVTAHDGFTMNDLVSYEQKHNLSNGEQNRDGADDNASRNYGVEGPVEKGSPIDLLRVRQIKNMMSWLFFSEGAPMLLSGDEMRRTQDGNNNAYNQDDLNEVKWNLLNENSGVFNFAKTAIGLHKSLQIGHMRPDDIIWHGTKPNQPDWSDGTRFIARQFKPVGSSDKTLYIASNSWEGNVDLELPPGQWRRIMDTNMADGTEIKPVDQGDLMDSSHYTVKPYTTVAFVQDVPPGTSRPLRARTSYDGAPPPIYDKTKLGLLPQ